MTKCDSHVFVALDMLALVLTSSVVVSSVMVPDRGVYVGAYTDEMNIEEMDAATGVRILL
jgi:hypothetical protein